ncbi:MAG: hypothetical protein ACOC56_02620 [Atribacterota bacterium]
MIYRYINIWDLLRRNNHGKNHRVIFPEDSYRNLERHISLSKINTKLRKVRMMEQWFIREDMRDNMNSHDYIENCVLLACLNILDDYIEKRKEEIIHDNVIMKYVMETLIIIKHNKVNIDTKLLDLKKLKTTNRIGIQ